MKVSAIIPVYNESERVLGVINAMLGHELIDEIIVVNDGSSDNSKEVLEKIPGINFISYEPNHGKSFAIMTGIKTARNDLVMLIDSDLIGLNTQNFTDLIGPVVNNQADMTISLRENSLMIYKTLGLDFVSGERVFSKRIFDNLDDLATLRFGLEVFMNNILINKKLRLKVVTWNNVISPRKSKKEGWWSGQKADYKMIKQIVAQIKISGVISQIYQMRHLKVK